MSPYFKPREWLCSMQPLIIIKSSQRRLKISHLCVVQMLFNKMASVCFPFFFLLFVLSGQSWPLISIMPIMQMRTDHILVQMSKASAEARSPLGRSGNLHLKAILCDKTMAQVLCPWPRALSSPVRQKVGVTPVSVLFCSPPGSFSPADNWVQTMLSKWMKGFTAF